jgi:polysaccharide biosynthesis transport protein
MESHGHLIAPRLRTLRQETADDTFQLMKLWYAIWHRKWKILLFVLAMTLLAGIAASFLKPVYRASATVMVDEKKSKAVSFDPKTSSDNSNGNSQYLDTQVELLKSRSLAVQVVQSLDLTHDPEFAPHQPSAVVVSVKTFLANLGVGKFLPSLTRLAPPLTAPQLLDSVTQRFMELITIEPQGKSSLVKVQVDLTDPEKAAKAANGLVEGYIEDQMKASTGTSKSATDWMNGRVGELGQQLKDSEARLQAYREAENLVDVKGVGTISAAELSLTSERMIDARRNRAEAESQYRQVQAMRQGGWERLVSVPAVLADPVVQQFKANQAKARAKVDELSSRYGPKHPAMDSARSELNAATASLQGQVEQVVAGIERNYQLAAANEGSLQTSVNTNKTQIQNITRKEFKLQELQREVDGNRQLYDTFMTRLKETAATSDLGSADTRIVDEATTPSTPIKPKKSLIVALAAILALFIACALALLRDGLNRTFRSTEQVEGRLNFPVLGIVPLLKNRERKDMARLFSDEKHPRFSESIRTIRTGVVLSSSIDHQDQIIVVTSSVPGEGKTTVSVNLAHALGQMERVLLIDGDLRRSSFTKIFGFPQDAPGLTNLISGSDGVVACIRHVDGIDVLCAGSETSNPMEMLSSPRFAKALELLKAKYKRIVIDSPPTQAVSDALILSRYADSMIYVVKSTTTTVDLAEKGIGQLLAINAPVKGIVINQVDIQKSSRLGYRYDGFYDYYGYSKGQA